MNEVINKLTKDYLCVDDVQQMDKIHKITRHIHYTTKELWIDL